MQDGHWKRVANEILVLRIHVVTWPGDSLLNYSDRTNIKLLGVCDAIRTLNLQFYLLDFIVAPIFISHSEYWQIGDLYFNFFILSRASSPAAIATTVCAVTVDWQGFGQYIYAIYLSYHGGWHAKRMGPECVFCMAF